MYNYEELSINEIFDLLRQWRENNERKSEEIVSFWERVMINIESKPKEKYLILEQLIVALLDCSAPALATGLIEMLEADFPGSHRVMKFRSMLFEASDDYEQAFAILYKINKADEMNAPAFKRCIAIAKSTGLINSAISKLVEYLNEFMSDMEAWQELSELYLQVQEYSRAAFCVEELILHQPHNHLFHQRLADIRYTMGGVENMELAKTYYCQALKLNHNNMRALLGLILATNSLLGHYKTSGGAKRKEVWKLCQWAQTEVTKRQREAQGSNDSALTSAMLALSIGE